MENTTNNIRTLKIPCEVWSRVVGYFRPVAQFNPGKKEEFWERQTELENRPMYGVYEHECRKQKV